MLLLGLLLVAAVVRDIADGHRYRSYGGNAVIVIDVHDGYDTRIADVVKPVPGGWKVGDRFLAAGLPLEKRLQLYGYAPVAPDDRLDVTVLRNGRRQQLALAPTVVEYSTPWQAVDDARNLTIVFIGLVALALAAWLVVAQQSPVTWAFFLSTFGLFFSNSYGLYGWHLPGIIVFAAVTVFWAFSGACTWSVVQFAARFPDGRVLPSGRSILWITAIVAGCLSMYGAFRNSAGVLYPISMLPGFIINDEKALLRVVSTAGYVIIYAAAAVAMFLRYRVISAEDRAKIRAVFLTLCIGAIVSIADNSISYWISPHAAPTLLDELLVWSYLAYVPIVVSVFYAVLRQRVFDIRFVLNRALVYGVLTATILVALRLVDLFVSRQLAETRLAILFEILVTLAFAVSLDRLREGADRVFRVVLFRERERQLAELRRLRANVNSVQRPETIDTMLTTECCAAMQLTSAAVFRLEGDALRRQASMNWPDETTQVLDPDAMLSIDARNTGEPVRLTERSLNGLRFPDGEAQPAVAIPTLAGGTLVSLVIYGGHVTGEDIDPDELEVLRAFVDSSTRAYEHLHGISLRKEVAAMRVAAQPLTNPAG